MRNTERLLYLCVVALAALDPTVFRTLPREIRAELVTAWWNARPDVIAARKWATEVVERGQQTRVRKEHATGGAGSASPSVTRKRGRRGSDTVSSVVGAQARSIRDFMS